MRLLSRSETFAEKKPKWMSDFVFKGIRDWYTIYNTMFRECPSVSDLIDNYCSLVNEEIMMALCEEYDEETLDVMASMSGHISMESYARAETFNSQQMSIESLENLISDIYLITGYALEIDDIADGFVQDLDLASGSTYSNSLFLGPQIPLFRILTTTNEAYIRSGSAFATTDYIYFKGKEIY